MNLIDEIFVISFYNDEKRIKNITNMQKKFDKRFTIVDPIRDTNSHRSVLKTHLKIWIENLNKNVLIFEDDFFTHYTKEQIEKELNEFSAKINDFDLLLLGGDVFEGSKIDSKLTKVTNFVDTHAVVYNKKVIPKIFSDFARDISKNEYLFDVSVGHYVNDNFLKCYAIDPRIFTQETHYSAHTKKTNIKYDIDFLLKQEFDDGSIKIHNYEFNDEYLFIEYSLTNPDHKNLKIDIFAVDTNSGVRSVMHSMEISYGAIFYTKSGKYVKVVDELLFEIYNNDQIMIRKKILKNKNNL